MSSAGMNEENATAKPVFFRGLAGTSPPWRCSLVGVQALKGFLFVANFWGIESPARP